MSTVGVLCSGNYITEVEEKAQCTKMEDEAPHSDPTTHPCVTSGSSVTFQSQLQNVVWARVTQKLSRACQSPGVVRFCFPNKFPG